MRSQIQTVPMPPKPEPPSHSAVVLLVGIGALVAIWPLMILVVAWEAFVVGKLYGWFVQPLSDALPVLMFWQVFGLLLFVNAFRRAKSDREELSGAAGRLLGTMIGLGLSLCTGWLIVEFML